MATEIVANGKENPLLLGVARVQERVITLKEEVKEWFYRVVLSAHSCIECKKPLKMAAPGRSVCDSGHTIDPTEAFQVSDCCGARILRRLCHYACNDCGRTVVSRFLFDERLFDKSYFAERAKESRERKRQKREEIRQLLAGTRSGALDCGAFSGLDAIPGLDEDLNEFVSGLHSQEAGEFSAAEAFDMNLYRDSILSFLAGGEVMFSTFPSLAEDRRVERVRRFTALIFLWHEGDVQLTQSGNDLLVEAA